jgi:drug/metabolite transporter (DMT)-like permease
MLEGSKFPTFEQKIDMLTDYLKLHFLVFIWGFTVIIGLYISLSAFEVVLYRTFISAIGCYVLMKIKKVETRVSPKDLIKLLLTGGLVFGHWYLFFVSARLSNASVCVVGLATTALWTSLLEPIAKKGKIKIYEVLLGLGVIAGLGIIFNFEMNYVLGLALSILSAVFSASFSTINGQFTLRLNHVLITYYEMLGAFATAVLFVPLSQFLMPFDFGVPTEKDIFWLVILSLVCTVYAYSVSVELLKRITVFASNLTINLEPVYGILLAVLLLDEHKDLTPGFYWGTVMIIAAVFIYPVLKRREQKKATV